MLIMKQIFTPVFIFLCSASLALGQSAELSSNSSDNEAGKSSSMDQDFSGNSSLPAVDGINGKLAVGTVTDGFDANYLEGSFSLPLGHQYGLQIDGVAAEIDTSLFGSIPVYSLGAHLFWRDPSRGLLGAYANVLHVDSFGGLQSYIAGVEGALYLDRFSIDGTIGAQHGDLMSTDFFDDIRISYYPIDDLNLFIGQSYSFGTNSFNYGAEWALPSQSRSAVSVFAQGATFEGGDHAVSLGLRVYFGQNQKSLLRRHREDDPRIPAPAPTWVFIPVTDPSSGNVTFIFGPTSGYPF